MLKLWQTTYQMKSFNKKSAFSIKSATGEVLTGVVDGVNRFSILLTLRLQTGPMTAVLSSTDIVAYVNGAIVVVDSIVAASGQVNLHTAPLASTVVTGDYDWSNLDPTVVYTYNAQVHDEVQSRLGVIYVLPLQGSSRSFPTYGGND